MSYEPNTLKLRLHQVNLDRKVKPLKVLLTGDWHVSPIVSERQLDFLKDAISQANPDLIIVQGDLVDSPVELGRETSLKKLMRELKVCAKAAPTVVVLGNHDYITPVKNIEVKKEYSLPRFKILCQKCGVKLLIDEWCEMDGIRIFGALINEESIITTNRSGKIIYKENAKAFEKKLADFEFKMQPDKINWFAAHAPLLTPKVIEKCQDFDVMSFGHTHGGMVPRGMDEMFDRLNIHRGLYSARSTFFPKKVRGSWQEKEGSFVVVNTGMTGAQFCAPRAAQALNFMKAAEVSLVEITGTN